MTIPTQHISREQARPMDTAPTNGTMVRLLVNFEGNSLEDTDQPVWTIGACYASDSEGDVWQFAGWNWSHDCFTEGHGVPIGWLPMIDTTQPADTKLVEQLNSDEVEELIHLCKHAGHDVDDFEGECPACTARVKLEALSAAKAAPVHAIDTSQERVRNDAGNRQDMTKIGCVQHDCAECVARLSAKAAQTEPPQAVPEASKVQEEGFELGYAQRIATAIWMHHYVEQSPNFKVLPDLAGVLSQIDNMICGLVSPAAPSTGEHT